MTPKVFTHRFPSRTLLITALIGRFSVGGEGDYATHADEFVDDITAEDETGKVVELTPAEFEEVWQLVEMDLD